MSGQSFNLFSSEGRLSGAQAKLSGAFHNINNGNMVNAGVLNGIINVGAQVPGLEEKCKSALRQGITNPLHDRSTIARFLRRERKIKVPVFDWILNTTSFKSWKQTRTHPQLLWISGGTGMGKTPLALFLINELEAQLERAEDFVILYYFCDRNRCTRNHAVSVLRGLIVLLIEARPRVLNVLLSDYEALGDSLFSQGSLEALWTTFEKMTRDPSVGRIYCIIDGVDQCVEDSLKELVYRIADFYDEEKKQYELRQASNMNPAVQKPQEAGLQMILISREKPKYILKTLEDFPRIRLRPVAKKAGEPKLTRKKTVKTTKLASVAREAVPQETERVTVSTSDVSSSSISIQASPAVSQDVLSAQQNTVTTSTIPTDHGYSTVTASASATTTSSAASQSDYATVPAPLSVASAAIASLPAVSVATVTGPETKPVVVSWNNRVSAQIPETLPEITSQAGYVFDEIIEEEVETYVEEEVEEEMNENQSLAIYIKERVGDLATEMALPENISLALVAGLDNLGDGTFLWVDLAIEEIKRYQPQDAELVLEHLPTDVNEIYCRTLASIPPHLVGLVVAILRWVLAARRPLLLEEVAAALKFMNFQSFDPRQLTLEGIGACGAMLAVDEDDTLHVSHNSVKDLLTDETGLVRTNPALFHFYVNMEETDGEISALCLRVQSHYTPLHIRGYGMDMDDD